MSAAAHRLVRDRPRAPQRPELQAQIGVVGDENLGLARDVDGGENQVRRRGRDRLADAGDVQDARGADRLPGDLASVRRLAADPARM